MKPDRILLKMESYNEEFIDTVRDDSDELSNSANFSSEAADPLQELGADGVEHTRPNWYRMNRVVFAEPLKKISNEANPSQDNDEIMFLDNVMIQKETSRKYKKYHINIENGSQPSCPQLNCYRTFSSKNLLVAHIRRVHCVDRRKYICERCGRGFSEQHLLQRHALVHTDTTVQCPVCSLKLRRTTSLSSHLRSHSNLRPHECSVCKKTFTRASSKATHVKFVHREGLLKCDECEKRFSSRKQWSLHMKSHRQRILTDTS